MISRLEVMTEATNRASLFVNLVRDLRCISLGMPKERKSAEQRKDEYQRAASVISDNPKLLKELGISVSKEDYSLMDKIAEQDDYKDGPEIERLRSIFRVYNRHYLSRFRQASREY